MSGKLKILVVDDSEIAAGAVRAALVSMGHEVVTSQTSLGLAIVLHREKPDLVFLDISMPLCAGDEALTFLHTQGLINCPVLLFSDRAEEELYHLAGKSGAQGFLRKTADTELLSKAIQSVLRSPA